MAKPDWGELQQRFLSDHAATGVSPKDWCKAQGLNYATARRYIKKPSTQTAQKTAQKTLRTAQKEMCAEELVDSKLSPKVKRFIAEYLKDQNATAAAERAGYSDPNYGRQLLTNPNVAQAIAQQQKASIVRTLGSADEVLEQMWRLATFDANQLSQYRRGSCRYCWGFGHQYQWRDAVEDEEKRLEALERKRREPVDVGGYGYDHTSAPNSECPRCNGDGIGQPFFADTRKLAPDAALAYSGVKLGKNGVEISCLSTGITITTWLLRRLPRPLLWLLRAYVRRWPIIPLLLLVAHTPQTWRLIVMHSCWHPELRQCRRAAIPQMM